MISIKNIISRAAEAIATDVLKIKHGLDKLAHYKIPDFGLTEYTDEDFFEGIKSFQKKENLKIDGIIKPDGPTLKKMNEKLWELSAKSPTFWCTNCGAPHGDAGGNGQCPHCNGKQA